MIIDGSETRVDWVRKFCLTFIYMRSSTWLSTGWGTQVDLVCMFCLTIVYISEVLNMVINRSGNSGQSGPEVLPDLHLDFRGPQRGYQWVGERLLIPS